MIASNGRPSAAGRWIVLALALWATQCAAASLDVAVEGMPDGVALDGAVVSLHSPAARAATRAGRAVVVKSTTGFQPRVLPVAAGSDVRFTSADAHRHALYAFSSSRPFAFTLPGAGATHALGFETPGVVEYGCAIHESMVGYVVVLDTPYYATTGSGGQVRLDAPAGDYELRVWHEQQPPGAAPLALPVHVEAGASARVRVPVAPLGAAAAPQETRLRDMRERFRRFQRGG